MGLEGTVLDGKYRVVRRLGAGGMGEVYEAIHEGTERPVAVKVMYPEYAASQNALVRFSREARAAGRIGHDNICEVTDVGRMASGAPYLVMPLLRGSALTDVIREAGPMPVPRAADIADQILSALAAAHDAGIVHRDLKPDNVFIVRMDDRDDFVKILDFGIAKMLGDPVTDAKLTRTGSVMGTPYYMSPEQARGITQIDGRVDQYAAGIILYEMLTTRTPFLGDTYNQILSAILLHPFPPPRALRKDLPPAVEAVVLRAMDRDRDHRFPDCRAMRQALLGALAQPAAAGPLPVDTTGGSLAGTVMRSPGPAPSAEAFSIGPASGRPASGLTIRSVAGTIDTAVAPGSGRRKAVVVVAAGVALLAAAAILWLVLRPGADAGTGRPPPGADVLPAEIALAAPSAPVEATAARAVEAPPPVVPPAPVAVVPSAPPLDDQRPATSDQPPAPNVPLTTSDARRATPDAQRPTPPPATVLITLAGLPRRRHGSGRRPRRCGTVVHAAAAQPSGPRRGDRAGVRGVAEVDLGSGGGRRGGPDAQGLWRSGAGGTPPTGCGRAAPAARRRR